MFDITYRIWLVKYLLTLSAPPLALFYILSNTILSTVNLGWNFHGIACFSLCLLATPSFWFVVARVREWQDSVNAARIGARIPPLIRGKRFGDFDLFLRWAKGLRKGYIGAIVDELLDEMGADTARISTLGVTRIITRDPDVVKFVLSTGFNDFEKGAGSRMKFRSFFGKGIFGSDGERAKMHRSLARPHFARERISDYETFHKHTDKMVGALKQAILSGEAVEMQDLFRRFTMDAAGDFLFGTSDLNALDLPLPKASGAVLGPTGIATQGKYGRFVDAFEQGQINTIKRMGKPAPVWAALEFFCDSQSETVSVIKAYLEPLIRNALDKKAQMASGDVKSEEEALSFLDHLVLSTEDVELVKDQLLNMLLAARDTTASLLTFACYLLSMHPDVMSRLREEILVNSGSTGLPTYDSIKELKYLRAVLDETMRVFPPTPGGGRESKRSTVIPTKSGPLFIPREGWHLVWSRPSIYKRKDIWGEDADVFIPDRWLDSRAKEIDPSYFTPFSAGPRVCLGQEFAYNQTSFVLVRLLQAFDVFTLAQDEAPVGSLPPDEWKLKDGRAAIEKIYPQAAMTMYSKGGLWLRMHVASN